MKPQKTLISAGGNMIVASSKGDMLDEGSIHLSNNQTNARSTETTSKTTASNGRKSPVNIESQSGAAADQSTPSNSGSRRTGLEMSAWSGLSLNPTFRGRSVHVTASFILTAMIIKQRDYLKTGIADLPPVSAALRDPIAAI
ncbi:hypothetical protein [Bradyrhizobium jicamae]|uniref:hypothetical protein n=1 Tax=Bradyrhizobium jicamae TaxID=280332 RepID=UPI0012EDDBF4|nr:hypothetical protein [Bradyrhizobium jicamae]